MDEINPYKPKYVVSFKTYLPRKDIIYGLPRPHSKRFFYRSIPLNSMKTKRTRNINMKKQLKRIHPSDKPKK